MTESNVIPLTWFGDSVPHPYITNKFFKIGDKTHKRLMSQNPPIVNEDGVIICDKKDLESMRWVHQNAQIRSQIRGLIKKLFDKYPDTESLACESDYLKRQIDLIKS